MYINVDSSIIRDSQKVQASQVSINVWMDIQNVLYKYNGMLFSLKKEILTHATIQMNLEDITLSEINQTWRDKYCVIPFICGSKSSPIH